MTATERGYGKRTLIGDYPRQGRGGQGVIAIQTNVRNGGVVAAELIESENEVMLITTGGTLIRTRASEVSIQGRNTQGVRLIDLGEEERLASLERVIETESEKEKA